MIHTVSRPENRRDLDAFVRRVYDEFSAAGDRLSRQGYEMLVRGGANALHRFGRIIVPQLRAEVDEPHLIELAP